MTEIVSGAVAERRFLMLMLASYAAVALGIAAVGAFGVVAFQVAQRTNEFGIRLALGASPRGLLRMVVMQSGRLALAGLTIGLASPSPPTGCSPVNSSACRRTIHGC